MVSPVLGLYDLLKIVIKWMRIELYVLSHKVIQISLCALMSFQRESCSPKRMIGKVVSEKSGRTFYKYMFWQGRFRLLLEGHSRVPTLPRYLASSPGWDSSQLHTDVTIVSGRRKKKKNPHKGKIWKLSTLKLVPTVKLLPQP